MPIFNFPSDVVANAGSRILSTEQKSPARQQIHIILDNLSAHKKQAVRDFLEQHRRVQFHLTPTYSSWLNQVEIWFAKIERDVIARGIFTSVSDQARKLRRFINAYSANARPIQWKYSTPPDAFAVTISLRRATSSVMVSVFWKSDRALRTQESRLTVGQSKIPRALRCGSP